MKNMNAFTRQDKNIDEDLALILYVQYCIVVVVQLPLHYSLDIFTKHPNDYYIKVFCSCKISVWIYAPGHTYYKSTASCQDNQRHISNSVKDKEKT